MFKVKSKATIRRLSGQCFAANRSLNVIRVSAIALTTVLFTALFTIGSGLVENFQRQTMRQAGGDGMAVLKYISDGEYERVKDHPLISEISYNQILSDEVLNEELLKRHGEFYYMDDVGIKLGFCEPVGGHKPEAENEIMMDTEALRLLGVEQREGAPVTLKLSVRGREVERDFVLSGWWEADPVFQASLLVGSKAYAEAHEEELYNSYREDSYLTGAINSYIMFRNSMNLEKKLERVITESGYSRDETASDYLESNVNWAYLSAGFEMDLPTSVAVSAALLLIVFAGYLIIYNIFRISVMKDIRFYGLLKTIGATGRQIKSIIRRQAVLLSCMGIPPGLLLGYLLGCGIVPYVMDTTFYKSSSYQTSAHPLIFVGSVLFVMMTVALSVDKPGRMAGSVSPVEAVRYTDVTPVRKKSRKSVYGNRVAGMAMANLSRSGKRTLLVILSMSLSLVIFNTVYTLSIGIDMDKFLAKFVDTDYLIAHAEYFRYNYMGNQNAVTESIIEEVENQPGFEEGGRFFANRDRDYFSVEYAPGLGETVYTQGKTPRYMCMVYGLDDFPLERLEVLEGEIDWEKLHSGEYILSGVWLDDYNKPEWEAPNFDVGETVTLCNEADDTMRSFTVMAKVAVKYYTNSSGIWCKFNFYMPSDVYGELAAQPSRMSYVCNVADEQEAAMEAFLKSYTESVEPTMAYTSKATRKAEFEGMQQMVLLVGGALSLFVGLIGVLNFVNSILTDIFARRREFAMLQSIGMTGAQLRRMLMAEGVYYAAGAGLVALVLSVFMSCCVMAPLTGGLWFFTWQFTLLPLALVIPLLFVIGILLPVAVLHTVERQSIVERLRETEG
ncbi:MAG: ABC transporter permease [Acetatifactor sp.]|nr:ABC transporter permease [Acetatifactor sp.]